MGGGQLDLLSPNTKGLLAEEKQQWLRVRISSRASTVSSRDLSENTNDDLLQKFCWEQALLGMPPAPRELMKKDLLAFRETQQIKGKYFTNGRQDFDIVSKLLLSFSAKQALRHAIIEGDAVAASTLFTGTDAFADREADRTLANEVLDRYF